MRKIKKIIPAGLMLVPFVALAVSPGLDTIILRIQALVNTSVPIFFTIALIVFVVGVIKYITAGDDEEKRTKARYTIIYGIIGLFAIFAVWGLVKVIADTFSIEVGGVIEIPGFKQH